jgi:hypothetical protein
VVVEEVVEEEEEEEEEAREVTRGAPRAIVLRRKGAISACT